MEVKCCTRCSEIKSHGEFAWKNKSNKLLSSECKECHRKLRKQYYEKNKTIEIRRLKKARKNKKEWFRNYKKKLECEKCGENRPATIQFHHLFDNKEGEISKMVAKGFSEKRIIEEIAKCEVLCANCHMQEHFGYLYK